MLEFITDVQCEFQSEVFGRGRLSIRLGEDRMTVQPQNCRNCAKDGLHFYRVLQENVVFFSN
jgi:hypothetical protein